MPGTVLQIGPLAILEAFQEILKTHLGTRVAAWETAMGLTAGTIKVPDVTTGYSISRKAPQDESLCVRLFVDNSGAIEDVAQFPGLGSRLAVSLIRIRFRTFSENGTDTEMQCDALSECARDLIVEYYRAYFSTIRAVNVNVREDWRAPSIREQYQTVGSSFRGRADDNTQEEFDLICTVTHSQKYAAKWVKDLPVP